MTFPFRPRTAGIAATAAAVFSVFAMAVTAMAAPVPHDSGPRAAELKLAHAYYAGCGEQAVAEPSSVPIWCESADQRLENLVWSSWGGGHASATGVLTDNPCDCTDGTATAYPVAVTFDGSRSVGEVQRYQRLSITFAGHRPSWASRPTMHFLWGDLGFVSDQERA
ncbi:hypothetical protein [Curtobacterium flaccumfaciens]|uniref:hypothetical protein n=1 Tax=Curtobacterium flaccumfaciens TaxID=2035 RepID=UPI00112CF670|nr:hypothetical protein [Curtobacterium flaccumfaciens]TPG03972.1 hypothetical protein EAH85_17925 [Curtobacterium flaccumfaciens]